MHVEQFQIRQFIKILYVSGNISFRLKLSKNYCLMVLCNCVYCILTVPEIILVKNRIAEIVNRKERSYVLQF